jgi:hypothetical protein
MKGWAVATGLALLALLVWACPPPAEAQVTPRLTIARGPNFTGSGVVVSSPAGINCGIDPNFAGEGCQALFNPGTVVTLTATANAGSVFTGFSGAGCSGSPCTFTITAETTVAVSFTLAPTLTVIRGAGATGTGTVTSSPPGISCRLFPADSSGACGPQPFSGAVTLTATPDPGSAFAGWSGGGCSGTGTCTPTLTANTTVVATFSLAFTVTVAKTGLGTGTVTSSPLGIACGGACSAPFPIGTAVTLTATPGPDSAFIAWSGGGCSGAGTCIVTSTQTVTANFAAAFALTVLKAGTGSGTVISSPIGIVCGDDCAESYPGGTSVTLTATPAPGSVFAGWSGGGCSGTAPCTVSVSAATSVTATFATAAFTVTVTRAGTGTGTVTSAPAGIDCGTTCVAPFTTGASVTLTAVATPGSIFAGWTGGGCSGIAPCTVSVSASTAVTANFASIFTLTVVKTGTGTGTVTSSPAFISCGADCAVPFPSGTSVTLSATPASDSRFSGWTGGGCSGTGSCTVVVTAATSVTATFSSNVAGATLVAAVLPSSRSVTVNTTATVFATMINLGPDPGLACSVAPSTSLPLNFSFQTTNPATNQLTGAADAPVTMAAGAVQSFLLSLTPTSPITATEIAFTFKCSNTPAAPVSSGLNTLAFSAAATPIPDIVALVATAGNTGIVDIPGPTGVGVFSVATVNVGAEGVLTLAADTGSAALPVVVTLCQTNPQTGQCISAVTASLSSKIDPNATPTYAVFVQGTGIVPFDPANNRIFVRFRDEFGVTRGSTSVAVRTQ